MEEYELKRRMAEALRENIFKIPRRNREYEMVYQPMMQVSPSNDSKINVKFALKYKESRLSCNMLVETDGAYVHVSGVGAYFDKLFIKGRPDVVCSEFVKWLKFARNGVQDGDYAFMFYLDKPVGVMVCPSDKKYSYAFFAREIEACGLKARKVLELYSPASYEGNKITCKKMENTYLPMQAYGKGIQPVNTLSLDAKRTLLWSMMCNYSLNRRGSK